LECTVIYEKLFDEDPSIERKGFVLVCDATNDQSVDAIITLLQKLTQIEKSNDLVYPKGVFINKIDKVDKEKLKKITEKLDQEKPKIKFDYFKTSALTNYMIVESFKKFLSRIHQIEADSKQNEGYEDKSDDDDDKNDKVIIIILKRLI
jgi:GTPase involved in cell partitioning and DNA repair